MVTTILVHISFFLTHTLHNIIITFYSFISRLFQHIISLTYENVLLH